MVVILEVAGIKAAGVAGAMDATKVEGWAILALAAIRVVMA